MFVTGLGDKMGLKASARCNEEVAADIFIGTFTPKWREAATVASSEWPTPGIGLSDRQSGMP